MNTSFELLSSMSPKLKNRQKTLKQVKPITVLALKKHFRRSSVYDKFANTNDDPVIIENSTDSGSTTDSKQTDIDDIIELSDNEESLKKNSKNCLTLLKKLKFNDNNTPNTNRVQKWLDNLKRSDIHAEESFYSQASTICGVEEKTNTDKHEVAASSTIQEGAIRRFDELFMKQKNIKQNRVDSNTHKSESEVLQPTDENVEQMKSLLDSLYGTKWRDKHDHVIPMSEPSNKIKSFISQKTIPVTEKKKTINTTEHPKKLNFEKLKKPIQSPWMKKLKNICDSDTSDSEKSNSDKENKFNKITLKKKLFDDSLGESSSDEDYDKEVTRLYQEHHKKPVKGRSYTFLESLSSDVPLNKCDISARIFRSNFKTNKDKLLEKLFNLYNDKVFGNALPKETALEWNNKLRNTAGLCYCVRTTHRNGHTERKVRICLSTKVIDCAERLRDTLVHEMCHAATWVVDQVSNGHGPLWKRWAFKAMKTFPELPPIKRCHAYTINTKYTYTCTGCGYSIGRHSKSLDIERKRCGHCYGKFEVFVNKTSKSGDNKTVPASAKKELTGFALFVKTNYALYKEPTKKHADVMKILGQKFAEIKIKN